MSVTGRMQRSFSTAQGLAFLKGMRDATAPFIAVGTWGFVTGIAMVKSGLSEATAVMMTVLVYAGSAQLTALPLMETGAPLWLVFAAGMVVNVRFVIFGAALQPFFRQFSVWRRLLLSYLISDIGFVLFMARYSDARRLGTSQQVGYFLGIVIPGWLVWNGSSIIGIYLGGMIPASWALDFAAVLALLAIIVPLVKTRPMMMCLVAAGLVAWVGQALPLRLGLAAAVVAGVAAGMVSERLARRAQARARG